MPYMVVDYLSIVHCTKHITDGFDGIVYLISLVFSQVLYSCVTEPLSPTCAVHIES